MYGPCSVVICDDGVERCERCGRSFAEAYARFELSMPRTVKLARQGDTNAIESLSIAMRRIAGEDGVISPKVKR